MIRGIGAPLEVVRRGSAHCRVIAALYGADRYPPHDLEVDVAFGRLRHVGEQMPSSAYYLMRDPSGRIEAALERARASAPATDWSELERHLQWLPFYVHDAVVACRRQNVIQLLTRFEEIRQLILFAAALRDGAVYVGSKEGLRHLHPGETAELRRFSRRLDLKGLRGLVRLYHSVLSKERTPAAIQPRVGTLEETVAKLIPFEARPN